MRTTIFFAMLMLSYLMNYGQNIELFGKFETHIDNNTDYENPYDYDEVAVSGTFTSPNGEQIVVDGFYIENYDLNTTSGSLVPSEKGFKVRFSPNTIGTWNFEITKTDSTGTNVVNSSTFECIPSSDEENHGFVRTNSSNYLSFDDGTPYVLVGENMAWQTGNVVSNYKAWVARLAQFGGNFIRLWHAHWGLGIEWKDGSNSFKGLRKYQQIKSRYQDWLYDFCAENGVYVMLCLQHHGQVSSNVNPNWNDSPYNIVNGGSCSNTWDFFTDSLAIANTKNRLRYVVARWSYSKNIMAWELFNEVEWTDNFANYKNEIAEWHFEMSNYIKSIDPYGHIVTTSYAHDDEDPIVWSSSDMDITQTHYYNNVPNLERVLAGGVRRYLSEFNKPTLTGEFGLGGSASLANNDPDGIHLHNSMWGALMGGGMGTAMTWWWDSYIHPLDLYFHFDGVEKYTRYIPFIEKNLKPTSSYVSGALGDLNLTPTLGWGSIADDSITISINGFIDPPDVQLGQYLYGAEWNTQYRNPPNFYVNFPQDGYFEVTTSSNTSQNPRIKVSLDSTIILDTLAKVNTSYLLDIPEGEHLIKVENAGTDWITIAGYRFSDLGSKVDSYVLLSEDNSYATGWILNNAYNHVNIIENGEPVPVASADIHLPGFEDGYYIVTWFDCLTGDIIDSHSVEAIGDELVIPVADLYWDAAFIVDTEAVVSSVSNKEETNFKLYPNPTHAGGLINISGLEADQKFEVSLISMAGQNIFNFSNHILTNTEEVLELNLPTSLSAGMYWVKVQYTYGKVMVLPVVIGQN